MNELHWLEWRDAQALMRAGDLGAREYVEALLARIAALDGSLNAFLEVTAEQALAAAARVDQARARGDTLGPLAGVPFALKDIIDTAGVRTTCHSALRATNVPASDATVARRLAEAGGILLGKLATHEFAIGGPSFDLPWPPARNPWDTDRFPGGSSSGSGAAVAAGLVPLALGTDTAGSVRNPASLCGIVGMKPTYGLVSRAGVYPLSYSLDHVGPMTRTVADNAAALNVLAGFDAADPSSARHDAEDYTRLLDGGLRGVRIGALRQFYTEDIEAEDEVRDAIDTALQALALAGAEIVEVSTRPLREYIECNRVLLVSEAYAVHEQGLMERPQDYGALTRERLSVGAFLRAVDYVQANRTKRALCAAMNEVFQNADVVITSSSMDRTCRIDDAAEVTRTYQRQSRAPFNLTGLPALAVPCGFDSFGLPLGLQIAGPAFGEAKVYQVAHAYERLANWYQQHPEFGQAS